MKVHKYGSNQGTLFVLSGDTTKPFKGSSLSQVNWLGWAEPGGKNITEMSGLKFTKDVEEKEEKPEKEEKTEKKAGILSVADYVRKLAAPVEAPAKEEPATVEKGKEGAKAIFEDILQGFHHNDGTVDVRDGENWQIRTRTGLRFPLKYGLFTSFQYNYDFVNVPADGKEQYDAAYIFKLGWGR